MKSSIHPQYYPLANVTCSCGNQFSVGSTKEKISVEICSNCHPLYTGTQKFVDTAGRIDKFKARVAAAAEHKVVKKAHDRRSAQTADSGNPKAAAESPDGN